MIYLLVSLFGRNLNHIHLNIYLSKMKKKIYFFSCFNKQTTFIKDFSRLANSAASVLFSQNK